MTRLDELIQKRGLKKSFIAQTIGRTPKQMSAYCKRPEIMPLGVAFKLASVLNCRVDDLITNQGGCHADARSSVSPVRY